MILDYGRAFARNGFRYLIIISGHAGLGHLVALEEAAASVSRRYHVQMIAPSALVIKRLLSGELGEQINRHLSHPLSPEEWRVLTSDYHAGAWETSLMLYLRPDLVAGYQELPPLRSRTFISTLRYFTGRDPGWLGYLGAPALARPDIATAAITVLSEIGADLAIKMLDGQEVRRSARSGLRYLLPIRTDFPPYLFLAVLGAILLGRWWRNRGQ